MEESIDQNWHSNESPKNQRNLDQEALKQTKALEVKFSCFRKRIIEKTPFGYHIKYIKKGG